MSKSRAPFSRAGRRWIAGSAALITPLVLTLALQAAPEEARPGPAAAPRNQSSSAAPLMGDAAILANTGQMLTDGRRTFRYDTFGDEDFWGGQLKLHQAIAGAANGGTGGGVSPKTALDLGLKVDVDALPARLVQQLRRGQVNLNDPATTLALLKAKSVVGVTGFFDRSGHLTSMGIQCALCHSTVDNSLSFGIGHRLDGWPNRDLNVGAIVASAPDLSPFANLLGVSQDTVRQVLNSWGPGKFDAELMLDGKAVNPVTGKPAATLIPAAFGLAGHNLHTSTGAWGTVTYWNAFVANIEMRGKGVFFDPRLDDAAKFPIAAAHPELYGHIERGPDEDQITGKMPALHFYQLAIPAPKPRAGRDFDAAAAARGDELFSGKARCNNCHREPLWTEPGWNLHKADEIGIEDFQAKRAPDDAYRTMNLAGIFTREAGKFMRPANAGRFYHDGRFKTLLDVVNHYDGFFGLGLTASEKHDLVEYLKSL